MFSEKAQRKFNPKSLFRHVKDCITLHFHNTPLVFLIFHYDLKYIVNR